MINTRRKGNKTQNLAVKELRADGWQVSVVERVGRFLKERDLWDNFDIAAIKEDKIRFIQVKSNSTGGIRHKIGSFASAHKIAGVSFELWVHKDREKGFRKDIFEGIFIEESK